jgi:hypothetical protein
LKWLRSGLSYAAMKASKCTFVFEDPASFFWGGGDGMFLLGSSSDESEMMILVLLIYLFTTLTKHE